MRKPGQESVARSHCYVPSIYKENCDGQFGDEWNKKDTKMINLAGFVEELIEVGKGEGCGVGDSIYVLPWKGRGHLWSVHA
jgi:hypothetical protein